MEIKQATNTTELKLALLETIDGDGYFATPTTQKEKRDFLRDTFQSEYGWAIPKMGKDKAIQEWLRGLPSALYYPFYVGNTADVVRSVLNKEFRNQNDHELDDKYWPLLAQAVKGIMYGKNKITAK
jgi:hypothetical protein